MRQMSVADVMTDSPVTAREDMSYQDLIRLLTERSVSAVPVIDRHHRVLGVVSATDLSRRLEFATAEPPTPVQAWRQRHRRRKAGASTAAELMTSPAVTVGTRMRIDDAARLMTETGVGRLPVVDDFGRLVGMVSHRDLVSGLLT